MKYRKRAMCLVLCWTMLVTGVYTTYKTPQQVKAVAVEGGIAVLLAILAATGCMYYGTQVKDADLTNIDNWDWGDLVDNTGWMGEPEDRASAEESLQRLYENAMIQEGYLDENGNWTGDGFDPDNDDPNDKPPKWDQLKDWMKNNGGKLKVTAGGALASILGLFGKDMYDKSQENVLLDNTSISLPQFIQADKSYKYIIKFKKISGISYRYDEFFVSQYPFAVWMEDDKYRIQLQDASQSYFVPNLWSVNENTGEWEILYNSSKSLRFYPSNLYYINVPIFSTKDEAIAWAKSENPSNKKSPAFLSTDTLPFSADAQNYIASNPDSTTLPVASTVTAPSLDDMKQFLADLVNNKEDSAGTQTVINNFITEITSEQSDPEPTSIPDPKPTSAPDPDPTSAPDPDPTSVPDPKPTSAPDPKPTSAPDPDSDLTDKDKGLFLLPESIKNKFPFCIPWDLVDAFSVLEQSRAAPKVSLPLKSEKYGIDYTIEVDMSVYDEQAALFRLLELLLFIVGLILVTRNLIRG